MKKIMTILGVASAVFLTGCATTNGGSWNNNGSNISNTSSAAYSNVRYGRVIHTRTFSVQENDPNYGAIIAGGVIGGLLGNQVGGGSGKALATIAGAAGGAYAGDKIAGRNARNIDMVELQIREDNGATYTVTQKRDYNFMNGQRVRITMNGDRATVSPY